VSKLLNRTTDLPLASHRGRFHNALLRRFIACELAGPAGLRTRPESYRTTSAAPANSLDVTITAEPIAAQLVDQTI